jgi:hypothetical protein
MFHPNHSQDGYEVNTTADASGAAGIVVKAKKGTLVKLIWNQAAGVISIFDQATALVGGETPIAVIPTTSTAALQPDIFLGIRCANGIVIQAGTGAGRVNTIFR